MSETMTMQNAGATRSLISRAEFEKVFPTIADDMINELLDYGPPEYLIKWFRHSLEHNTLGGKYNRGMSVVDTMSLLLDRDLKKDELFQATVLGWLTELLQAYLLVADDIMDESYTRRGNPCWYRMPEVGLIAINDAFMLEAAIYQLLKRHFRHLPCYIDLVELFHEVSFKTEVGQQSDLLIAPPDKVDLSAFSLERYNFMVKYKTAFYSFYLPVALALHLTGLASDKNLKEAEKILLPLGEYFQVQDDYLDNFGAPEVIGKIGTDIQDNKGSWLINQAILRASFEQRTVLDENYGQKSKACEARVKTVFADLKLDEVYEKYEDEQVAKLKEMIGKVDESKGLKKEVFEAFLKKIYKRSK